MGRSTVKACLGMLAGRGQVAGVERRGSGVDEGGGGDVGRFRRRHAGCRVAAPERRESGRRCRSQVLRTSGHRVVELRPGQPSRAAPMIPHALRCAFLGRGEDGSLLW